MYGGVANGEVYRDVEQKLPNAFVTNDGVSALQPVGHIVNHVEENGNQAQDGENRTPHEIPLLKGNTGHAQSGNLQTNMTEHIKEIVYLCNAGLYVFNVRQTEHSRQDTPEDALA